MSSLLPQRKPFPRSGRTFKTLPLPRLQRFHAALVEWATAPESDGADWRAEK